MIIMQFCIKDGRRRFPTSVEAKRASGRARRLEGAGAMAMPLIPKT